MPTPERQCELDIIALAGQGVRIDDTLEIGGDSAHVAHLSPEELAEDRKVIAEMLKEHGK